MPTGMWVAHTSPPASVKVLDVHVKQLAKGNRGLMSHSWGNSDWAVTLVQLNG